MMSYLKNMKKIGKKVRNNIKKELYSEFVNNTKYLKAQIASYNRKIKITYIFLNINIPKEGSQCISVPAILVDPVFRLGNNYYLQVF